MPESQILVQPNPDGHRMGSDLSVVNAARKSFGDRSDWQYETTEERAGDGEWIPINRKVGLKDKDKRLIQYLARGMTKDEYEGFLHKTHHELHRLDVEDAEHMYDDDYSLDYSKLEQLFWKFRDTPEHDTPFNHMFMSFEVKAPVFVARQLVKHEYLVWSEYSRRYKTDDVEFYTPDTWRGKAENKKQGSSSEPSEWNHGKGTGYRDHEYEVMDDVLGLYLRMLEVGVAPEQARMVLPQSLMTSWTWSGSFGAFAKMLRLRLAEDSQYETRLVAQQTANYAKEWFPLSYKALVERDFS
jgi:thymidylate synthase (FAD)